MVDMALTPGAAMREVSQSIPAFCGDPESASTLSVEQARQRIIAAIVPLADFCGEWVPLPAALDRVLAEDVVSAQDVPPHANAAMDGYALLAADLPAAGGTALLREAGASFAGHPYTGDCCPGACVRIMTGAVLPPGLDTVVPVERTWPAGDGLVGLDDRTRPGDNVRAAGEDIRHGETVLTRGRRVNPADLGVLASLGLTGVCVARKLRVAHFSTGDELRETGQPLAAGQIHDSNRYTLHAMLRHRHCDITDLGIVRDDPAALRRALAAAAGHDLVISTGGVSVGDADYVRQVFAETGEIDFWKIAMKPGRPLTFGRLGAGWFFGLPGNPVAVMVGFSQFVLPALQRLAGEAVSEPLILPALAESVFKKRTGRTDYQRGMLRRGPDGNLYVASTGEQGSGVLTSMSRANCFIILAPDQGRVEPGHIVNVQPFTGWL